MIWNGTPCDECTKTGNHGYGYAGHHVLAHRRAYIEQHGPCIPPGWFVLHHCDNRPCKNWQHLFLGQARDNTRDMMEKGRNNCGRISRPGSLNPQAKLTEGMVLAIRADHRKQRPIANDYGVTCALVCKIKRRKIWKHI